MGWVERMGNTSITHESLARLGVDEDVVEQLERSFAVPEDKPVQVAPVPASKTSPTVASPTVASPTAERPAEPAPKAAPLPEATDPPESVPQPKPRTPKESYSSAIHGAAAARANLY